jgi:hypothetical protein
MTRLLPLLAFVLLGALPARAEPPAGLKGKSVVLRWTEHRVQRAEGHAEFRPRTIDMGMSVYVSSQGRVFNRMQSNSGSSDQVDGQGGDRAARIPSFSGRGMTIHQPLPALARRIAVEFDAGFNSCSASVILGKESGAASGTMRAFGTGRRMEIQSAKASGATCSVRAGNVFGE